MTNPNRGRNTETEAAWCTALDHAADCHDCRPPSEGCEAGLALLHAHHQAWTKLREQTRPMTPTSVPDQPTNPDQDEHRFNVLGDIAYSASLATLIASPALLLTYTYAHH